MSESKVHDMLQAAQAGKRLSRDQAMTLYTQAELHELALAAQAVRYRLHPEAVVSYVLDRNINYSNICVCGCRFCAFYRAPGQKGGYVLGFSELEAKIQEAMDLGATQILLQGSHHPDLDMGFYEQMLSFIKEHFPTLHVHGFSPPEIMHFASISGMSPSQVLDRLIAAGLGSIPGGGAEILVDRVRREIAPNKCSAGQWLQVMDLAHTKGLLTTATMMFGHVETLEDRVDHLLAVREQQDRTNGFTAFIPWSFQPDNTALSARKATSIEYLRLVALSRLVLDNVPNLQVSWVTMGAKIGQLGLFFGANDFGSTMLEENVVAASGVSFRMSQEHMQEVIRAAGFEPRQRRMDYSIVQL
ncbi:MAG: cyclic dehypoxanthinyl futalosine synthase [Desulfovermiculus sp.]|nr:cyclic dehypoxanthinyl futalosine synthase [Desulfovermiculus sp.]